jgi:protein CpxP
MNRSLRTVALSSALCLGLATASTLFAQDAPPPQDQGGAQMHHGWHHGPMSTDQELAHMTKALNLSSDQQTQLKPILQSRQDQLEQIHQDSSLARPDKMAKMKALDDSSNSQVEAVLNDQQKAKYEKMMARRKARMQHMRQMRQGGDQGGDQGAPPPDGGDAQPQ